MLQLDRTTHESLTSSLPGPLRDAAAAAYEAFESMPMPTAKEEDWRYVEVPDRLAGLSLPDGPGSKPTPSAVEEALGEVAGRADAVDGHVTGIDGEFVSTLSDAALDEYSARPPADRFAAAARAFGGHGVIVRVPRGKVVPRPIFV